jgi:ABC-type antimicrobial peptide transport system permease subunit
MLFNYFKIAFRHLKSVYSLINISGLTIGLTVFLLVFLWVNDELSYDHFYPNHERTYRVTQNQVDSNGAPFGVAVTPPLLAAHLKANFPSVENSCQATQLEVLVRRDATAFTRKGLAADRTFFSVFSFPLLAGDFKSFDAAGDKIVVTDKTAQAYFAKESAVGKTLKLAGRELEVVAVVRVPAQSHLQFDFVVPVELLESLGWYDLNQWTDSRYHTYVTLRAGSDASAFEAGIRNIIKDHVKDGTAELVLQRLDDIHLRSKQLTFDMGVRHDVQYIYVFASAAVFVLLIACINYTNLTTARYIKRTKETGVRKVVGATRGQLMVQYFSESLLNTLIALGLAIGFSWLLLPYANELSGKDLSLSFSGSLLLTLSLVAVGCGFITGLYPALFSATLKPVLVLKGLWKSGSKGMMLRRILITIQFTLSITLVLLTLVVHHQLKYIQSMNMGFSRENIITFHIIRKLQAQYPSLKSELKSLPEVQEVTIANTTISHVDEATGMVRWEGKDANKEIMFYQLIVDHDFAKTFSIPMAEGRFFSDLILSDSSAYILNEEGARQINISKPIGATLEVNERRGPIVGIVKNFNFKSIHNKIEPMVIYIDPKKVSEVSVRFKKGDVKSAVKAVEKVFKKFSPDRPFEFTFLDEDVNKLYQSEQSTGKIFNSFSVLSIFVSCLGLLGVIMFTTELRAREMAIRKVMGASTSSIFLALSGETISLLAAANLVATPLAYWLMNLWLDNYAYHGTLPAAYWVVVALVSILIPWLTISYFCLETARVNPVKNLRNE